MPPMFKLVVTIGVWVLLLKGLFNVVSSLFAGLTDRMPMSDVEVVGGLGIAAIALACVCAWLGKKLEYVGHS